MADRKPVRVTVTITLDVDPEDWNLSYGTGASVAEVRGDVKNYIGGMVSGAYHCDDGTWSNVTRK